MYILKGFRLKCVFASMIAFSHFSLNVVPWYTTVSKKIVSVSDISAGEFHIRVMCKFIGSVNLKKSTMSGLLLSYREKMSFMWRFQTVGLETVLLKLCVSMYAAMKILERKLLCVLTAVSWVFTDSAFH